MPSSNKDIAEARDFGVAVDRCDHLDDITVNFVSIRETHSLRDALAALPHGQCQCPHWGYVLNGRVVVDYGNREETYGPGDAFYMTPGHVPTADAGTELVQFSPKEQLRVTQEAIEAAMAAHG